MLTFKNYGETFDMLENLSPPDTDRILEACKAMGLNVILRSKDADAMLKDIEEHGWLVNPWKADHEEPPFAK